MTVSDCVITDCSLGVIVNAGENLVTIRGSTFFDNVHAVDIIAGDSTVVMQENLAVGNEHGFTYFSQPVEMIRNDSWGNGAWDYKDSSDPLPTDNLRLSPLWCDFENFTLHINSPCGKPSSAFDPPVQIGARGVACASGVQTQTEVTVTASDLEAGGLLVLSDYKVDYGKTLTLESGIDVTFDPTDEYNLGITGSLTELVVTGTLNVNGTNPAKVQFRRSDPDSAWGSIYVPSGSLFVDYGEFSGADRAIATATSDTVSIQHSTFSDNDYAIQIAGEGPRVTVSHNVLQDNAFGIHLQLTDQDSVLISNNRIEGSSTSLAGIYFNATSPTGSATVTADTASGFDAGAGLLIASGDPVVTLCHFIDSRYGVEITDGAPLIGTDSSSDNTITGNTRGIYVHCTLPTNCPGSCTVVPVIRNNLIDSNTYGFVTEKTTAPDLGTGSGDKGLNTITNSGTYCIWNRATACSTYVQAYGNYFGTCTEELPPDCWEGLVNIGIAECSTPSSWGGNVAIEPVVLDAWPVQLLSIRPNPVTAGTSIQFSVNVPDRFVTIDVFDIAGRLVRTVARGNYPSGTHEIAWTGNCDTGVQAAEGLYFVRIASGNDVVQTAKIMVTR